MTTNRMKDSLADGSRDQTRKAQLAEDREVTRALQSKYDSWATRHPTAAQDFVDAIKEILSDAGLAFDNVTARVKSAHCGRRPCVVKRMAATSTLTRGTVSTTSSVCV